MKPKFIFRQKELSYDCEWINKNLFSFKIKENSLTGIPHFIYCEYQTDTDNCTIICPNEQEVLCIYSDCECSIANNKPFPLTETEINHIKEHIKVLIKNTIV